MMNDALKAKIFAVNTTLLLHDGEDHTTAINEIRQALTGINQISSYEENLIKIFYERAIRYSYSLMCQDYNASSSIHHQGQLSMSHAFAYRFQSPNGEGYKQELIAMLEEAEIPASYPLRKEITKTLTQYSKECSAYHKKNASGAVLPELMSSIAASSQNLSSSSTPLQIPKQTGKRKYDDTQEITIKDFQKQNQKAEKSLSVDLTTHDQLQSQDATIYRLFKSRNMLLGKTKDKKSIQAIKKNDTHLHKTLADSHYNFALTQANKLPLSKKNLLEARDHFEQASDIYRFTLKNVNDADVTDSTIGEIEAKRLQMNKRKK
jgi:hypothetical protein